MDEFFEGLVYATEIVHDKFTGKPIDRALQKFLSAHMDGKKVSLEIVVKDKNALNLVLGVNRFLDEHKHLANLDKKMESIIEHLDEHPEVTETESIKDIFKICFVGYDNRTIEIKRDEVDPDKAGSICQNYDISCVANYRHHFFGAKDAESWKRHTPKFDERMVIYAKEGEEALRLFKEISHYLGRTVAERKKYGKYAFQAYRVNTERFHMRPAGIFINAYLKKFKENHRETDIWFRTDTKEVDGTSIMHTLNLALKKGDEITISCKPQEVADKFYKGLEAFHYEGKPLFVRAKD